MTQRIARNTTGLTPVRLALLFVGLALAGGCQKTEAKVVAPKPPEVFIAYPIHETVIEHEDFTGRIMAVNTVEIRARVSGYLDKVLFTDGADVKAGDPLFEIDPRTYKAEVDRAQATVSQAQAKLSRLKKQEERSKKLFSSKNISQEEHEAVGYDRAEAEAAVSVAQSDLELAQLNLGFTRVSSPLNARISRRLVDPGNLIKADETPLVNLVSLNPIYAYFDVDERTVLRMRRLIQEGKIKSARDSEVHIELALADETDFTLKGTINFVDNQIDASTGTLRVRAVVENPNLMLAPGMFVRLRIGIGAPRQALLVREEALGTDQGQRFIYVVNEKDEVVYRRVKVGWLTGGYRVIEDGIQATDRVIVTGLQRVRPGVKVSVKPAPTVAGLAPEAAGPSLTDVPASDPKVAEAKPADGKPAATDVKLADAKVAETARTKSEKTEPVEAATAPPTAAPKANPPTAAVPVTAKALPLVTETPAAKPAKP